MRFLTGASDEARTRYLHLGKVALYQMSYTRNNSKYYSAESKFVNRKNEKIKLFSAGGIGSSVPVISGLTHRRIGVEGQRQRLSDVQMAGTVLGIYDHPCVTETVQMTFNETAGKL